MKRYPSINLQYSLILYALCFASLGCYARILELDEGDVCNESIDGSSDSVCRLIENCMIDGRAIRHDDNLPICSFIGEVPVVCCPPNRRNTKPNPPTPRPNPPTPRPNPFTPRLNPPTPPPIPLNIPTNNVSYSADEMCHDYSNLIYTYKLSPVLIWNTNKKATKEIDCLDIKPLIVGGENAKAKEFPHMVLLGYEKNPEYDKRCGGSLISKRWVLTAAHCKSLDSSKFATWARVGELNFKKVSKTSRTFVKDIPKDYRIVQRVIHPNYNKRESYDDIALFRLNQDVVFSPYVRPICLNTDQSLTPQKFIASGWGNLDMNLGVSQHLQKVVINNIPVKHCKSLYSSDTRFPHGINKTSMICAGELKGGKDTCPGDSGGPLQIINNKYQCMYTQVGITSIGSRFCGAPDTAGVYTRISNYISWIEPIVWPKN